MRRPRRGPWVVAALAACILAPAAQAQERAVDASRAFPFLDGYYELTPAQRSRFTLGYALRQNGKPAVVEVTLIEPGGKRTPLAVDAEGRVTRLPTAAQMAGRPQVAIDAAAGKIAVTLLLESTLRPAAELPAAPFAPGIEQVNAAIALKAGMLAAFAPRMSRVTFIGAPSGVAVMADGREVALALAKGGPTYNPATLKGVRSLKFPRAPERIRFDGDR